MSAKQLKTFSDIYTAVLDEVKIQSSDTTNLNRIKRDINIIYMNEILPAADWYWARRVVDVVSPLYISTGTVAVTNDSQTITFSSAPTGSVAGYRFAISGYSEVYTINTHVAGATTATLTSKFNGDTNSAVSFKTWLSGVALPNDCIETYKVWNDHHGAPMENLPDKEFLRLQLSNSFREGRPAYYRMTEFIDPEPYVTISGLPATASRSSSGLIRTIVFASTVVAYLEVGDRFKVASSTSTAFNGEFTISSVSTTTITMIAGTELTSASTVDTGMSITIAATDNDDQTLRRLEVFPALCTKNTTVHVEYIRKISPLENDGDEPAMPIQDRASLLYGALSRVWARMRNPEEESRNLSLFNTKIAKMKGKIQDNTDFPQLIMNEMYISSKYVRRRRNFNNF